jgi:hypothetical protein
MSRDEWYPVVCIDPVEDGVDNFIEVSDTLVLRWQKLKQEFEELQKELFPLYSKQHGRYH